MRVCIGRCKRFLNHVLMIPAKAWDMRFDVIAQRQAARARLVTADVAFPLCANVFITFADCNSAPALVTSVMLACGTTLSMVELRGRPITITSVHHANLIMSRFLQWYRPRASLGLQTNLDVLPSAAGIPSRVLPVPLSLQIAVAHLRGRRVLEFRVHFGFLFRDGSSDLRNSSSRTAHITVSSSAAFRNRKKCFSVSASHQSCHGVLKQLSSPESICTGQSSPSVVSHPFVNRRHNAQFRLP